MSHKRPQSGSKRKEKNQQQLKENIKKTKGNHQKQARHSPP